MEDPRKNFVLLSKVAEEKKYAQEYLGLLARRGDIGSIRIGKRWYTKREWFSEFLADAEARKAEAKTAKTEVKQVKAEPVEKRKIEKVFLPRAVEFVPRDLPEKIVLKKTFPRIEQELPVINPVRNQSRDPLRLARSKNNQRNQLRYSANISYGVNLRKIANRGNLENKGNKENWVNWENLRNQKKEELGESLKIWNVARDISPSFLPERKEQFPLFPKFAFAMSVVLLLVLLFQFGIIYKKEIARLAGFESGVVAGVEKSKLNLSVVKDSSLDYLGSQSDKTKESISLSRVLVRAAMERNSEQGPTNNDQ
ncbi:MAG: hypothetical protein QMD77_00480 [Patescibacteria group bacterium]|nr:hypothetical protein [Patescibacteria group bacterium]